MAVSTGHILRFTMFQRLSGQQVLNVDYRRYVDVGGSGNTYQELWDEYALRMSNDIGPVQATALQYERLLIENMSNGIEFLDAAYVDTGLNASPTLPSSVAIGVKQLRETKVTRNGSKRIAGVPEGQVSGNDVSFSAGVIAAVEAFYGAAMLIGDGTAVNDALLEPVIVGRTLDGSGVYQIDLSKINPVVGAVFRTTVSTQNTRKPGSGA